MAIIAVIELSSPGTVLQLSSSILERVSMQPRAGESQLPEVQPGQAAVSVSVVNTPVPRVLPANLSSSATPLPTVLSLNDTVLTRAPTAVPVGVVIPVSPTPTLTPVPSPATPTLTPTLSPTVTPTTTATPVPTSIPPPALRHYDLKKLMLDLVNQARAAEGLQPVELGDNVAAQIHAEGALRGCYGSHWDSDGLKPYMRYSLAGGYQSNAENSHGLDYCLKYSDGYSAMEDVAVEVREAIEGWMTSPGHRRTILTQSFRKLNIGMAWDSYNFVAYQHFEGNYVRFDRLPEIQDGTLAFSGELLNESSLDSPDDLGVQVYYDPPPHPLTTGQLARSSCYDSGLRVASIRSSLPPGWSYPSDSYEYEYWPCVDPYDIPGDAPAARSYFDAMNLWREANQASQAAPVQQIVVPRITADEWRVTFNSFQVSADVSRVVEQHGPGVYTLLLWAELEGTPTIVAEYSMFHDTTPPNTYDVETAANSTGSSN